MAIVYIALGANLGDPLVQAKKAIVAVNTIKSTKVIDVSPFYRSKPLGPQDQPDYLNAVLKVETTLSPLSLLDSLQKIELDLGRVRKEERFGPRTLDLDILLYDNLTINTERLTVPHYDMKRREFVLYPLFDIAPDLILPGAISLASLIENVPINGMVKW